MRLHRRKPEPPLAEELAPFVIAIPTRCLDERIVTRQEVLTGLRIAARLAGPYYAAKKRAHLVKPPDFAQPLHRAYHSWPAKHTHASLSSVLGTDASAFSLILLILSGNNHQNVLALFREAMIFGLQAASGGEPRTAGFEKLLEVCVEYLGENCTADPVLARLVLADTRLRRVAPCGLLSDGLLPWDLPACLQQADFPSAVRALHAEHPILVASLLLNPRLRSDELGQAFSVVNTPETEESIRCEACENLLRHESVTAPLISTIAADSWRHVAATAPEVIGNLWSAFSTDERHWLSVCAALAPTPFSFTEHCAYFAERIARWSPDARALAATLLTSSPVPATATAGNSLR